MGTAGTGAGNDSRADRLGVSRNEVSEHNLIEVDWALLEELKRKHLLTGVGVDRCGHNRGGHVSV